MKSTWPRLKEELVNKSRVWIFIVLGLLFAVGAGVLVFYTLQQQSAQALEQARTALNNSESASVQTLRLPVAARQLEAGSQIATADYVMKDFPLDLVPITAISNTAELETKTLISTVAQGETFHATQFLGAKSATISQQIEPGNVVMAFPINDLLSQSDVIEDGDRLDLLLTIDKPTTNGNTPSKVSVMTVQNVTVLQVLKAAATEDKAEGKPTALLLSIKPEDAVMIKYVKDSGGIIDFTLRSTIDQDLHKSPTITFDELAARYGIR